MKIIVLGCGTSTGVPVIGCDCEVCRSSNPKNKRTRSSILIQGNNWNILVDTATDLYHQALRENIRRVDAVIYTHTHADHLHGIDELRIFNFLKMGAIDIYSFPEHIKEIRKRFSYIFEETSYSGGGKPILILHEINPGIPFKTGPIEIIPVLLYHGEMRVVGVVTEGFAYLTDCNKIASESYNYLNNIKVLIIDALRYSSHPTHFSLKEALEEIEKIRPQKAYLTHMTHAFDYDKLIEELPEGVEPAYDGLVIEVDND